MQQQVPITLSIATGQCRDGTTKVQVPLNTTSDGARQGSDVVCVLDISDSMGNEATIVGASGQSEGQCCQAWRAHHGECPQ